MAAFFRTAMTRAEGVKFRVKKNGPEVVVEPVSETISTQAAEIYHVLDLAEPGYQAFKKWYFSFPPVKLAAMIDAWFRKLWIPGKAYGLASDGAQKLSGFAIE